MKTYKLEKFTKGWFIGNFDPTLVQTRDFEVAVKYYRKGDTDQIHYHKVADEYTVIINGIFEINDKKYKK